MRSRLMGGTPWPTPPSPWDWEEHRDKQNNRDGKTHRRYSRAGGKMHHPPDPTQTRPSRLAPLQRKRGVCWVYSEEGVVQAHLDQPVPVDRGVCLN